jgi:hypothetical protein
MSDSSIDFSRLEKIRHLANGDMISACPACRETGKDTKGDNLRVFASGAYHCIAVPNDKEHNSRIFALVGIKGERVHDPEKDRLWRQRRNRELFEQQRRDTILKEARECRAAIIARYAWPMDAVLEDSPRPIDCQLVALDPRHFLASLFSQNAIVWTGETEHSGNHPSAEHSWKTVREWQGFEPRLVGPMTSPAIWPEWCNSRSAANVATAPFTVLDFDGFDGVSPKTPAEMEAHISASLAIIRWLREKMQWQLSAILHTGNKSLHAWFHTPPPEVLASLKPVASPLGMDAGLIGRPEHPCRLPGHRHAKSGNLSRVLWLQRSPEILTP